MAGLGTAYVELQLDRSKFDRSLQKLEVDAKTMPIAIEDAFKNLGVKSSYQFDLMREKAVMNFERIKAAAKNSAEITANDIIRAERAKNETLTRLQEEQFGKQVSMLDSLKKHWLAASAAIYASMRLAQQGWAMASEAADFQERIESLDALGQQANLTGREILSAMQDASRGLLSMTEAADIAASALNLSLTPDQMIAFTRVAERLTDVIGGTVPDAFNRMTVAAASGRTQTLAQMGIIVDLESAYEKYAASVGRTRKTLSEQEEQQVRLNVILDAAKQKVASLGEPTDSTADKMARFVAQIKDLRLQLGEGLLTAAQKAFGALQLIGSGAYTVNSAVTSFLSKWLELKAWVTDKLGFDERAAELRGFAEQARKASEDFDKSAKQLAESSYENLFGGSGGESKQPRPIVPPIIQPPKIDQAGLNAAAKKKQEQDLYLLKLDLDAEAQREKQRAEFLLWDTQELEKKFGKDEALRQRELEGIIAEQEAAKSVRSEFLIWDTNETARKLKEREEVAKSLREQEYQNELYALNVEKEAFAAYDKFKAEESRRAAEEWEKSFFNMRGVTEDLFQGLNTGLSGAIRGVIQGTQTMEQAFKNMGQNIMLGLIDSVINRGINAVSKSLVDSIFGGGGGGGGGIPWGAIGSTVMSWAGSAWDWLGALDTGLWRVPGSADSVSGLAALHGGEMVVPADAAEALRRYFALLAFGTTGAPGDAGQGFSDRGPLSLGERVSEAMISNMTPGYGVMAGLGTALTSMAYGFSTLNSAMAPAVGTMLSLSLGARRASAAISAIDAWGLAQSLGIAEEAALDVAESMRNMSEAQLADLEGIYGNLSSAVAAMAATAEVAYSTVPDFIGAAVGSGEPGFMGFGSNTLAGGYGTRTTEGDVGRRAGTYGTAGNPTSTPSVGNPDSPFGPGGSPGSPGVGTGSPDTTGGSKGTEGPDRALGGIIEGAIGTRRRITAHAGELVANPTQQGRLLDAIMRGRSVPSAGGVTVVVQNYGILNDRVPDDLMRKIQRELDRRESRMLRY